MNSNLVDGENQMLKPSMKTRTKVSRACNNCRRKKIKCSGAYPCKSCQTYNCECIFSSPNGSVNKQVKERKTKIEEVTSGIESTKSLVNRVKWATEDRLGSDIELPLFRKSYLDSQDSDPSSLEECGLQEGVLQSENRKNTNRITPMANDFDMTWNKDPSKTILFAERTEVMKKITELKLCLEKLSSGNLLNSEHASSAIKTIENEIITLEKELLKPSLNHKAIRQSEFGMDPAVSLESKLLRNRHSETIHFNEWVNMNTRDFKRYLNKPFMINIRYGIFSPSTIQSLRGVGACFKIITEKKEFKAFAPRTVKEIFYIVVLTFDVSDMVDKMNANSWVNPMQYYCEIKELDILPDMRFKTFAKQIPEHVIESAVSIRRSFDKNEWYMLIDSDESSRNCASLLHWLAMLYEIVITEFHRTSGEKKFDFNNPEHRELGFRFDETIELIACLSFHVLRNTSMFRYDSENLLILEDLLEIICHEFWIDCEPVFSFLIALVVQLAKRCGLHRWETYIVMDEKQADHRRNLWWKTYIWDRLSIFVAEIEPLISIDESCLFPNFVQKMNFLDRDDLMERFDTEFNYKTVDFTENKSLNEEELVFFGVLVSVIFFDKFYSSILVNSRYTNVRLYSQSEEYRTKLAHDVLEELEILQLRLKIVKKGMEKVVNRFFYPVEKDGHVDISNHNHISWFVLILESISCYSIVGAGHLLSRLNLKSEAQKVKTTMDFFKTGIYDSWNSSIKVFKSNYSCIVVWFTTVLIKTLTLSFIGHYLYHFSRFSFSDLYTIFEMLRILKRSGILSGIQLKRKTRLSRTLIKFQFFMKSSIKVLLHFYLVVNAKTEETLLKELEQNDFDDLKETVLDLLNMRPDDFILDQLDANKSELRLEIRNWFNETFSMYPAFIFPSTSFNELLSQGFSSDFLGDFQKVKEQDITSRAHSVVENRNTKDDQHFAHENDRKIPDVVFENSIGLNRTHTTNSQNTLPREVTSSFEYNLIPNPNTEKVPEKTTSDAGIIYNLGTFDHFIDHGDFEQIYSTIWEDIFGASLWGAEKNA